MYLKIKECPCSVETLPYHQQHEEIYLYIKLFNVFYLKDIFISSSLCKFFNVSLLINVISLCFIKKLLIVECCDPSACDTFKIELSGKDF